MSPMVDTPHEGHRGGGRPSMRGAASRLPRFPELFRTPVEADGLTLRTMTSADASGPFASQRPAWVSEADYLAILANVVREGLAVVAQDDGGTVLGSVSLNGAMGGEADLGWMVLETHRGQGHGTVMVCAVLERMYETGWSKVGCLVEPGNEGALAFACRLGFQDGGRGIPGQMTLTADRFEAVRAARSGPEMR